MPILALIIIGTAAGFLATRLMKIDADPIMTIAIGIFGAVLGGLLLRTLMTVASWAFGFIGAILGAMLLIWLWQTYGQRR